MVKARTPPSRRRERAPIAATTRGSTPGGHGGTAAGPKLARVNDGRHLNRRHERTRRGATDGDVGASPRFDVLEDFLRASARIFLPSCAVVMRCGQMERELTTTETQSTSGIRIACSDLRSDSWEAQPMYAEAQAPVESPPERVGRSDHQGARSGNPLSGSLPPTTAVGPQAGGASPSKWTRKTRPWNASTPMAVVDPLRAGPRSATEVISGLEAPEVRAGRSQRTPRAPAVRKDGRIHGFPVRSTRRAGKTADPTRPIGYA